MDENKTKKTVSFKQLFPHLLAIVVLAFFVCYKVFEWDLQAQLISVYLDAGIHSVCYIIFALEINRIIGLITGKMANDNAKKKTALNLLMSMVKVAVIVVAIVLILTLFIEDTSSLFTGMGLLGMVIGLGCNKLIADIVAGIFFVIDGSYQIGDAVVINGIKGEIKEVGIRNTVLLDKENNIRIFNNSAISSICNMSQTTSGAFLELSIEYDSDLDYVESVIKEELPKFKEEIPQIIAGPFYKGVQELGDSGITLRFIAYTTEDDKGKVRRKMNKRFKNLFDEKNIKFAYPSMMIYHPENEQQS